MAVVLLGAGDGSGLSSEWDARFGSVGDDVDKALRLAADIGGEAPLPGNGATLARWQLLSSLGAADLTMARVLEPHLDALAILAEADAAGIKVDLDAVAAQHDSTWGVFAAEAPGTQLTATLGADGWRLNGEKPWCSLADRLSHALVTAHTPGGRGLFAISLRDNDIETDPTAWVARGLSDVSSGPIRLTDVPAVPVGASQWYLTRPGFAWGGIGVAAVWLGGAVALARSLHRSCVSRPDDVIRLMHLGAVDSALSAAVRSLVDSAAAIDTEATSEPALLAARVRGVVADAAELTLTRVGHAMGPGPLALDDAHARRVADLQLYLRQHHAERDQVALGTLLINSESIWW